MSNIRERAALVDKVAAAMGKKVYSGETPKNTTFRKDLQKVQSKVVTLEDAIRLSGLKDGMTISFHHHFRGGDKVVNMVVGKLAEMGFKNLHLAASSLSDVHAPLIDHIKNGVITKISTSGLRGELAKEISHGLMKEPVVFRSHGGRGSAIANGDLHIDVAFLGASSSDPAGNASGYSRSEHAKSICGSLGYAKPDAQYADKVVIITDDLVDYPNTPNSISEHDVDYVVLVDSVGDSSKISSGAIRDTKNPRDILLAMNAAKVIVNSGYFKEGFSIQTGSGGASLAAVKYIREEMIKRGIHSSFALGGITAHMVKMHEEGLIERLIDVQSFDRVAAESIKNDPFHKVTLNEDGVCSLCAKPAVEEARRDWDALEKRFAAHLDRVRGTRPYEGLIMMSGGKDSALVGILCKAACDNTVGIMMPCASKRNFGEDMTDGLAVAEQFNIETRTVDLTAEKELVMQTVSAVTTLNQMATSNIAPRLRMLTLYTIGAAEGRLVAGTGNRSEAYMGYFTKWGDGAYDFNPIADLTVTEIYEFLTWLHAPENIIRKAPSAGLFEGQTDEQEMGVTYAAIDKYILTGEANEHDKAIIDRYHSRSEHKRRPAATYHAE